MFSADNRIYRVYGACGIDRNRLESVLRVEIRPVFGRKWLQKFSFAEWNAGSERQRARSRDDEACALQWRQSNSAVIPAKAGIQL